MTGPFTFRFWGTRCSIPTPGPATVGYGEISLWEPKAAPSSR